MKTLVRLFLLAFAIFVGTALAKADPAPQSTATPDPNLVRIEQHYVSADWQRRLAQIQAEQERARKNAGGK